MRWTGSVTDTAPYKVEPAPDLPTWRHPVYRLSPGDAERIEALCVNLHPRCEEINRRDALPVPVANRDESGLLAFGRATEPRRRDDAPWYVDICAGALCGLALALVAAFACGIMTGWH